MGVQWKTTPETRAKIIQRYSLGEPCKVIAYDFSVSISYVTYLARKAGLPPRTAHKGRLCQRTQPIDRSPASPSTSTQKMSRTSSPAMASDGQPKSES